MSQINYYGERWGDQDDEAYVARIEDEKICLPHSCGPWIIGGEKEARQLIADIHRLIPLLPNSKADV